MPVVLGHEFYMSVLIEAVGVEKTAVEIGQARFAAPVFHAVLRNPKLQRPAHSPSLRL